MALHVICGQAEGSELVRLGVAEIHEEHLCWNWKRSAGSFAYSPYLVSKVQALSSDV